MRKIRLIAIATLLGFIMIAPVGLAMGPSGPAGKSNNGKLYLYQKDPATWEVVTGGAWGKMTYTMSGDCMSFVFNGHKLTAGEMYTLIYYPDPWPGIGLIRLSDSVAADPSGDVYIEGCVDTHCDLPMVTDANYGDYGAKIWLVVSGDLGTNQMLGWNPTMYLFEKEGIWFDDTHEELGLVQKDPATWLPVENGASGVLTWNLDENTFDFTFHGEMGVSNDGVKYALIYYPDPWPGNGLIVLGHGTADQYGSVDIVGPIDTGPMPIASDWNNPSNPNHNANMWPTGTVIDGAKIWLVLSGDVGTNQMIGWNPGSYLFEDHGIF